MSVLQFLTDSRVLIVAGKGGVGKSAVAAALAHIAHNAGLSVAHIELDGKTLPSGMDSGVTQFSLSPGDALREYLATHGLARVGQRLESTGILDLVASTAPGIDDLLVLGKIKQMEQSGEHDLIVVDGPAAGQAIGLLQAAAMMQATVSSGPISQQARDVRDMVTDPKRCRVILVTTPAFTPVAELLETRQQLLDDVKVTLGPVVVNGVDNKLLSSTSSVAFDHSVHESELRAAWEYRTQRQHSHRIAIDELVSNIDETTIELPRYIQNSAIVTAMAKDLKQALESQQ